MRGYPVLTGAAAALIASLAGALAQQPAQPVKVGVLECRGGASIGFIVGSVTNLGCVLRVEGVPEDRYRSEEHTSELQSRFDLVCRLLLEKKKKSEIIKLTQ